MGWYGKEMMKGYKEPQEPICSCGEEAIYQANVTYSTSTLLFCEECYCEKEFAGKITYATEL